MSSVAIARLRMPTYEVFLRVDGRDGFSHAGSLQAPDDEMATLYARETYIRRGEGESAWVVSRDHVLTVDGADLEVTAARTQGRNDGRTVAARRKSRRAETGAEQ
jgi:phenylacetate-CoA oxygenase PaaH subunit